MSTIAGDSTSAEVFVGRVAAQEPAIQGLDELLATLREELDDPQVPMEVWEQALTRPLKEFLARPGKRLRGRLTGLAWQLAGRTDRPPVALVAIVELLHAGSLIVDDIEDGSDNRRGRAAMHRLHGLPLALNVGNWLYCWPQTLLGRLELPPEQELHLHRQLADTLRRSHEGQALDLRLKIGEVSQSEVHDLVQAMSDRKTGSLFRLAAELGAVVGGADRKRVDAVANFGLRFGIALQMLNDVQGLRPARLPLQRYEDLVLGRLTWVWAWLAERLPPREFRLLQAEAVRLQDEPETADELAAAMLDTLGTTPREQIRSWLQESFGEFEQTVGPSPAVEGIRRDLTRLEQILG